MEERPLPGPEAKKDMPIPPAHKPVKRPIPPDNHNSAAESGEPARVEWASFGQWVTRTWEQLAIKSTVVLTATARLLVGHDFVGVFRNAAVILFVVAGAGALLHTMFLASHDSVVPFGRSLIIFIREILMMWLMAMIAVVVTLNLVRHR